MRNFARTAFVMITMSVPVFCAAFGENVTAVLAQESINGRRKKIIEWGWDSPTTEFLRKNIDRTKCLPFDGVVFPLRLSDGTDVSWMMWGVTRYEYSSLAHMVEDLTHTPFGRLTDRFIRVNVTPGNVDWFDDRAWSIVLHNFLMAAKVAKDGSCKGFVFDVEEYESKLFSLTFAMELHNATSQEFHAKVRQRGREWILTVSKEYPDIIILLPWAYQAYDSNRDIYGLLPDFLDGIFEAAPSTVRLIDAGESAYVSKRPQDFEWLRWKLKSDMSRFCAVPDIYKAKVEVGFGIWLDAEWPKLGWHQDDLTKNFFSPLDFKNSVMDALATSDEYVWIYSQKVNWWTGKNLPFNYVISLNIAKGITVSCE